MIVVKSNNSTSNNNGLLGSNNDSSVDKQLKINLNRLLKLPLFYLEDVLVDDLLIETEKEIDTTFNKSLNDTEIDDRFKNILNFNPIHYDYMLRLIHDDVKKNYIITFNPDYIPIVNTKNRSTDMFYIELAGKKNILRNFDNIGLMQQLSNELIGGEDNDIKIDKPDDYQDGDIELIRLNVRGLTSPLKSRIRLSNSENSDMAIYVETNEIYFLKMKKKKLFGDDTSLHLHTFLPTTLNKFNVTYLGRLSDVEYVYLPIQL